MSLSNGIVRMFIRDRIPSYVAEIKKRGKDSNFSLFRMVSLFTYALITFKCKDPDILGTCFVRIKGNFAAVRTPRGVALEYKKSPLC